MAVDTTQQGRKKHGHDSTGTRIPEADFYHQYRADSVASEDASWHDQSWNIHGVWPLESVSLSFSEQPVFSPEPPTSLGVEPEVAVNADLGYYVRQSSSLAGHAQDLSTPEADMGYEGDIYTNPFNYSGQGNEPHTMIQRLPQGQSDHKFYSHVDGASVPLGSQLQYSAVAGPELYQHSGQLSSMAESELGSPASSVLPSSSSHTPSTFNPAILSPEEEEELTTSRKPSPTAHRATKTSRKTHKSATKCSKVEKASANRRSTPNYRSVSGSPSARACTQCATSYQDEEALEKHVKTTHTRPFTCVFHFAGCEQRFGAKNEWKRHVLSQHLCLEYYHCDYDHCASTKPNAAKGRSQRLPPFGGIFKRKDLYTQHIRRMHLPPSTDGKKASQQAEALLKSLQQRGLRRRCQLPQHMKCPATNCREHFRGGKAWDERMEHVARHLERAAAGEEPPVYFGGHKDACLTEWAETPDVDVVVRVYDGWKLKDPLSGGVDGGGSSDVYDEDAEGEDC